MIDVPIDNSVSKLTDWAELYICLNATNVSKAELTNILEGELGDIDESTIDSIFAELERRCTLYGSAIPLRKNGKNFEFGEQYDWRACPEHVMCLIYSIREIITDDEEGKVLFERLAGEALKKYLNGEVVQFSFPVGRSFRHILTELANATHEQQGYTPNSDDNDSEVAVVGWVPHGDGRGAQTVVLLRIGAGKNWQDMDRISVDMWQRFVLWAPAPIPALAIPELVAPDKWHGATQKFKLVLDRARLLRHIAAIAAPDMQLRQNITDWCSVQLSA
jgi:hypothetical protein